MTCLRVPIVTKHRITVTGVKHYLELMNQIATVITTLINTGVQYPTLIHYTYTNELFINAAQMVILRELDVWMSRFVSQASETGFVYQTSIWLCIKIVHVRV